MTIPPPDSMQLLRPPSGTAGADSASRQSALPVRQEWAGDETGAFDLHHGIRTGQYCACIGLAMGMGRADVELISRASVTHDIGKQRIPARLLCKCGGLTSGERRIVTSHTTIGARLLKGTDSGRCHAAHSIALNHHERWDGSGYPNGLRGERIPLAARITSIADVFDALTSSRCYKPAWPAGAAVAAIEAGRASHFDPSLVDVFHHALPDILLIYRRYQEAMHGLDRT